MFIILLTVVIITVHVIRIILIVGLIINMTFLGLVIRFVLILIEF